MRWRVITFARSGLEDSDRQRVDLLNDNDKETGMEVTTEPRKGWAILELMGHVKLGGFVQQEELFGVAMVRIDIPAIPAGEYGEEPIPEQTRHYGASALYGISWVSEEVARVVAWQKRDRPVSRWQMESAQKALPGPVEEAVEVGGEARRERLKALSEKLNAGLKARVEAQRRQRRQRTRQEEE